MVQNDILMHHFDLSSFHVTVSPHCCGAKLKQNNHKPTGPRKSAIIDKAFKFEDFQTPKSLLFLLTAINATTWNKALVRPAMSTWLWVRLPGPFGNSHDISSPKKNLDRKSQEPELVGETNVEEIAVQLLAKIHGTGFLLSWRIVYNERFLEIRQK